MQRKIQRFDSRRVMNRDTYEIFHYLDEKPYSPGAHYHDFYEIFFFLGGDMDYWIDGNLYHLKPGDILLINPTELHKPVVLTDTVNYERMVIWINKSYLQSIENGIFENCFLNERKIIRLNSDQRGQMISLSKRMVDEYLGDDFASSCCCYALLLQILTLINRICIKRDGVLADEFATPTFITEVLSFIGENYSEKLTVESLANHFFISKYYLSHEFKKAVGTGVHRYITLKRLNAAYNLLIEGYYPSQVAGMCGFSDYTSFFKSFKSEYGVSPSNIKKI